MKKINLLILLPAFTICSVNINALHTCESKFVYNNTNLAIIHTFESADWKGRYNTKTYIVNKDDDTKSDVISERSMIFKNVSPYIDTFEFRPLTNELTINSYSSPITVEIDELQIVDYGGSERFLFRINTGERQVVGCQYKT